MKKIKNAVTKHHIFTSINVTHINSRKKEVAHAGYGRSLPSAFRMVYQYLMSLTHQPDVAEELAQETFCQAVSSIHRYDGSCKITTWLCAIAKNQYCPICESTHCTRI